MVFSVLVWDENFQVHLKLRALWKYRQPPLRPEVRCRPGKISPWSGLKCCSHVTDDSPDISRREFKGRHGSMAVLNGISNPGVAHILPETAGIEIRWRGAKEFGSRDVGTAVSPNDKGRTCY
jgi:hypothetical protein